MVTRTGIDLRSYACADILDLFPLTATRAAIRNKWNLPRPKKTCPRHVFCLAMLGRSLRFRRNRQIKNPTPFGVGFFIW